MNIDYAGKLRRYVCDLSNANNKCIKLPKIMPFKAKILKYECSKHGIEVPEDILDTILLLSNYSLPVSVFLNEQTDVDIHPKIKREVNEWIQNFNAIISTDNSSTNLSYWKIIFKYLHKFRINNLVWGLLVMLPTVEQKKIQKWFNSFSNISFTSQKSILETLDLQRDFAFLLEFRKDLIDLAEDSNNEINDINDIWKLVSVIDLQTAYFRRTYFKKFSTYRIRPDDVYLIYIIETALGTDDQQIILKEIKDASKVKLKIPPHNTFYSLANA